jgi:hypothetical protein
MATRAAFPGSYQASWRVLARLSGQALTRPGPPVGVTRNPVRTLNGENLATLFQARQALGLVLVDNCSYEWARPILQQRRQWTGGLALSPLLVRGATGSNVNPMLIL